MEVYVIDKEDWAWRAVKGVGVSLCNIILYIRLLKFSNRSKNIHLLSLCHLFFNIFVPKAKILPFNITKNSFATIIEWRTCCALSVECKFLPTWFVVPECISHMFSFSVFFLFFFGHFTVNAIIAACKQGSLCLYIKIPSFISVLAQY